VCPIGLGGYWAALSPQSIDSVWPPLDHRGSESVRIVNSRLGWSYSGNVMACSGACSRYVSATRSQLTGSMSCNRLL